MVQELLDEAAANLAGWHDTSVRALDVRTEQDHVLWFATEPTTPIYFSAITLGGAARADEQLQAIRVLTRARAGQQLVVCDSFDVLDLSPLGFEVMRKSTWMIRPPGEPEQRSEFPRGFHIERVVTASQMAAWEAASMEGFDAPEKVAPGSVHAPAILRDRRMQVFAAICDGEVVGGAMAYLSERGVSGVYGVSVVPGHRRKGYAEQLTWRCVLARPQSAASLQPSDMAASVYRRMGFEDAGSYTVWYLGGDKLDESK